MNQETVKQKMIDLMESLEDDLNQTVYSRELRELKAKYIFKDISWYEISKDYQYLKSLNEIRIQNKQSI